jgi:hypothetical protein
MHVQARAFVTGERHDETVVAIEDLVALINDDQQWVPPVSAQAVVDFWLADPSGLDALLNCRVGLWGEHPVLGRVGMDGARGIAGLLLTETGFATLARIKSRVEVRAETTSPTPL